ncbi:MAG: hypothetical protein ACEY26_00760 [Candidatus Hodgkinia cicadicola]
MNCIQTCNVLTNEKHVILKLTANDGDIATCCVFDCLKLPFVMRQAVTKGKTIAKAGRTLSC